MIVHFSEFVTYSPLYDAEVARISVPDANGCEYFAIVAIDGKGYRQRRDEAIGKCVEAIKAGCPPGEVRWRTVGQSGGYR